MPRLVQYPSQQQGFSLIELIIVVCLIAILFSVSFNRYQNYSHEARVSLVTYQASTFARTIESIKALSVLYQTDQINMGNGILIWINRAGWPYTSSSPSNAAEDLASSEGCKNLWRNLFAQNEEIEPTKKTYQFDASLMNGRFCRYMLVNNQAEDYFFDYDLLTGKVEQKLL